MTVLREKLVNEDEGLKLRVRMSGEGRGECKE